MKKFTWIFVCLALIFGVTAHAEKIEQIYSKLPEIKAYVKLDTAYSKDNISAYKDSAPIATNSVKPFSPQDGVSYIIMIDCSTSVSDRQMSEIKKCMTSFVEASNGNDRFVIASFGKTIDVLSNELQTREETVSAISSMNNNQTATVLFDAVSAANEIGTRLDASCPSKRVCVIFTDAVDYTVGGTTVDELMAVAEKSSAPIYTVAIDAQSKQAIDMLGRVSRTSGGEVFVADRGIANAFARVSDEIASLQEISFTAQSNVVGNDVSSLRIQLKDGANEVSLEKKFVTPSWNSDTTAPFITEVKQLSSATLELVFSENVENADKAENYTVRKGNGAMPISDVLYNSATQSAVITFAEELGQGNYAVSTANITDVSMEKNEIAGEYSFKISGFGAVMINIKSFFAHYWWAFAVLVLAGVIFAALAVIKKRKGVVIVDSKATFADSVHYEPTKAKPLPTHYLQLAVEYTDGRIDKLDINITQSIIFGRSSTCEVTIDDDAMSRQHFAIELAEEKVLIQNLSATNGTFVNGVALQNPRPLARGDVIEAGQEKFTVNKI